MAGGEKFLGKAEDGACEHGAAHLTDLGASGMGCGVCADMELDALDSRVQAGLDAPRVVLVRPLAQPLSYGDGMDAPGCPCGPDSACCGSHEYGAAATAAREAEASVASVEFAVRHRPAALDEVCSGRCNGTPTETCCGVARCADCHREHRYDDCDQLADEVRRDLYPEGCDCTGNATVCPVHRADKRALYGVEAEVRRRAEAGR